MDRNGEGLKTIGPKRLEYPVHAAPGGDFMVSGADAGVCNGEFMDGNLEMQMKKVPTAYQGQI
jgi:hypothetical protein